MDTNIVVILLLIRNTTLVLFLWVVYENGYLVKVEVIENNDRKFLYTKKCLTLFSLLLELLQLLSFDVMRGEISHFNELLGGVLMIKFTGCFVSVI